MPDDPYAAFLPGPSGSQPLPGGPDPYGAFTARAPAPKKPPREIGRMEATARGFKDAAEFGFGPAISGVAAAGQNWGAKGRESDEFPLSGAVDVGRGLWNLARENVIDPLRGVNPAGVKGLVTGDKSGPATKAYRKARDTEQEENEQAFEQHPGYSIGGQLAGALTTPMGSFKGASLLERVWQATKAGAKAGALGGVGSEVSKGGTPGEIAGSGLKGAVLGGLVGGAGSGLIESAGRGLTRAGDIYRGAMRTEDQAARGVMGALREDRQVTPPALDPEAEAAARRAGLPITNLDRGGQVTRDLARTAGNVAPQAWGDLERVTTERAEARPQRISRVINRLFGGNLDAGADQLRLEAEARRTNAPRYVRAYDAGDRPIWSPEMERLAGSPAIQDAMRSAVTSGQNRAIEQGLGAFNPGVSVTPDGRLLMGQTMRGGAVRGTPTYPNLQYWDYVQRDLADMVEKVQGREPDKARYLNSLHQQLNNELDRIVPEFQDARVGAWRFFQAQNASEAGRNFLRFDADPREAQRALRQMSRPDQELFARSFADELSQAVLKRANTLGTIKQLFTTPTAAQKIRVAFGGTGRGDPRSRELEAFLRAEAVAAKSKDALGNSSTARQQEMIRAFKATGAAHGIAGAGAIGAFEFLHDQDFDPRSILGTALIVGMVKNGAHKVDTRVMRRIGEMLASEDPNIARQGAAAVAHSPVLFNALRRATEAGTRITARDIGPDRALAGSAAILSDIVAHEKEHHHATHPDNSDVFPGQ